MSSTELQSQIWIPCPDCAPFHIRCPADALDLATAWRELPAFAVLMALLDADRRVEMILTNPETELVFAPERIERPGIPRPVRGVALFSLGSPDDDDGPVTPSMIFDQLRGRYHEAGIRLVDWVQIVVEEGFYRSMRIVARQQRGSAADYLRAGVCV
jgi:hypothetical protein